MNKLYIYLLIPFCISIIACEDVIQVDLAEGDQLVVVDAWLDNTSNEQRIILNKTVPYFDSTTIAPLTDATVAVNVSNGATMNFEHTTNGIYVWTAGPNQTIGSIDDQFDLVIQDGSNQYTASTKMNRVPVIDSIKLELVDDDPFNDDGIYAEFISRDIVGGGDTYWIKTYKDGEFFSKPEEINIAWDAGFDEGGAADGLVFVPPVRFLTNSVNDEGGLDPWIPGEVCRVEIHSVSNDAFGFLELMRDQLLNGGNGIFAEPLANTKGNISTTGDFDVLGVFNVAAISSLERIIE